MTNTDQENDQAESGDDQHKVQSESQIDQQSGDNQTENKPATAPPPLTKTEPAHSDKIAETEGGSSFLSRIILGICIAAAVIGLSVYYINKPNGKTTVPPKDGLVGTGNLIDGKEYMIYMRRVEVAPEKSPGVQWDIKGSAPDVYYTLTWMKNVIYTSDVKDDVLIAHWIPIGFDLKQAIMKGSISVDQAVNLPIIKRNSANELSDELIFRVVDKDVIGDDEVASLSISMSKLSVGKNIFTYQSDSGHQVVNALIIVVDNSLSTNEKIELLMSGE